MPDWNDSVLSAEADTKFASWNARRSTLLKLFEDAKDTATSLEGVITVDGNRTHSVWLNDAAKALERESFRIMVFGDFSSGKSTLINALLGEDELLPTKENPTTAFTTVLRWGEVKRAELYKEFGEGSSQEPEPVTIEEFQSRVALRMDPDGEPMQSPYVRGIVFLPFELLKSGVELIDSPGTNESAARERVTLSFLPQVDAIIFVTPAKGAFKKHDQDHYLDILGNLGHQDIFFVVNQFDLIRKESDREDVRLRCRNIVRRYTVRQDRLFFTSACNALSASNEVALQESGVPALMGALSTFCLHDRSRVKVLRPAEVLRNQVRELRKKIGDRRRMLTRSADELQASLDAKIETREGLQLTITRIQSTLEAWVDETEKLLSDDVHLHILRLVDEVPKWDLPKKLKVHLTRLRRLDRWGEAVQQIDDVLTQQLQREMHSYTMDDEGIAGFLEDREARLEQTLVPLLHTYEEHMNELRHALTGSRETGADSELPEWSRPMNLHLPAEVLSKISPGWSWGTASTGAATFVLASGSGLTLAGGVGLFSVGALFASIAAPIGIAAASVGGPLIIRALARRKLRKNVVAEFGSALQSSAQDIAKRHAAQYASGLRALTVALNQELRRRLEETIAEAEELIERFRSGRTEVDGDQRLLTVWEDSLVEVEDRVSALVGQVLVDMR